MAPATCAYRFINLNRDIAAGCKCDPLPDGVVCNFTRMIWRLPPSVEELWAPSVHSPCQCNEYLSIHNRVIGVVPLPTANGLLMVKDELRRMAHGFGHIVPYSRTEFLSGYTGIKLRTYERALDDLSVRPFHRGDAYIDSFIKSERLPPGKVYSDPRMISARGPRYNCSIGPYIKAIEHRLYRFKGPTGLRCIAKGLNCYARAALILRKFDQFECPVVFDGTRWRMLRDPCRMMSGALAGFANHRDPNLVHSMFTAIGNCELALCSGMPVVQDFALFLLRMGCGVTRRIDPKMIGDVYYRSQGLLAEAVPITSAARLSFEMAYGIDLVRQQEMENHFRMWDPSIVDVVSLPMDYYGDRFIDAECHRYGGVR